MLEGSTFRASDVGTVRGGRDVSATQSDDVRCEVAEVVAPFCAEEGSDRSCGRKFARGRTDIWAGPCKRVHPAPSARNYVGWLGGAAKVGRRRTKAARGPRSCRW